MDRQVAIVKDFTRAEIPDILEVLRNDALCSRAGYAGMAVPAYAVPQKPDFSQSMNGVSTSYQPHALVPAITISVRRSGTTSPCSFTAMPRPVPSTRLARNVRSSVSDE